MNYREILARLNGFSTPVFGVSWNPPVPEITVAKRVVVFLENRRVLYNVYELEVPDHCVRSVIEIRHFLTEILGQLTDQQKLAVNLRAMRAACIKFLDVVQENRNRLIIRDSFDNGPRSWTFFSGLGDLRTTIGLHLGILVVMYGLERPIDGELASILPLPEDKMLTEMQELE